MKEDKKINLYQKIQKIKKELSDKKLKKTGENKYSGFKYYELNDFVPALVELCDKYQVFTKFEFEREKAMLTIANSEDPSETITYSMPSEELELKGANKIQALGGIQTYLRRYLYMTAFDIVENEMFDNGKSKVESTIGEEKDEDKQKENLKLLAEFKKLINETETDVEKVYETFKVDNDMKFTQPMLKKAIAILNKKPKTNVVKKEEVF